ncbi:MAG: phage minor head protein [Pseudomonas sp.]|nr:phage minor head protein [Pseudomonas sp.]
MPGLELEQLYAEQCPTCRRQGIERFIQSEYLNAAGDLRDAFTNFKSGRVEEARAKLFDLYGTNLRKGVGQVYKHTATGRDELEYLFRFEKNVSRFAANKADYVIRVLERARAKKPEEFNEVGKSILKTFNRYQAVEYNTTVSRARTAKQFAKFAERAEALPNLQWIRTRSASPREEHLKYENMVLPKSHPFWVSNQPGNLWNCKCDWIETAKTATGPITESEWVKPAPGLEGNPAQTFQLITDKVTYIAKSKLTPEQVGTFTYPNQLSKMQISVMADNNELSKNILTGRILAANAKVESLLIRAHSEVVGVKNPEYLLNGFIADAKRIEGYSGIATGFNKALRRQGCKSVIIDFNEHFDTSRPLDVNKVVGKILNRSNDFTSGRVVECWLVFGEKSIVVTAKDLNRSALVNLIKGLMP